jgi:hypothetical protein
MAVSGNFTEAQCVVSERLTKTFEAIAKTAMQAAATSSDSGVGFMQKIEKAHTAIVLIVEDAMRGLRSANRAAVGLTALAMLDDGDEGKGTEQA